jgi:hypothetical protein
MSNAGKDAAIGLLVRRRFNFESREFLIISILTPKTTILGLRTGISGTII